MDRQEYISPYFPLGVFLLPGEDYPLRIFEPRYRQLIKDIRTSGASFTIPFVIGNKMQPYGCEVTLGKVLAEQDEEQMVITVEGRGMVEILSYENRLGDRLYAGGRVKPLLTGHPEIGPGLWHEIEEYMHLDRDFLDCCPGQRTQLTQLDILKALNLASDDKYAYTRLPDAARKETFLISRLHFLKLIRQQEQQLGNDYGLN